MWLSVHVPNDNPKVRKISRLIAEHFPEFAFVQDPHAELVRLVESTASFLARQHVARLFAHAAADFSAARADHLGDFLARLAQRSRDDPGRVFESRRRAFDFRLGIKTQPGL